MPALASLTEILSHFLVASQLDRQFRGFFGKLFLVAHGNSFLIRIIFLSEKSTTVGEEYRAKT